MSSRTCIPLLCLTTLLAGVIPPSDAQNRSGDQTGTRVVLRRVPDGGIQPQVVAHKGSLHLIYLKGDPRQNDVWYTRSDDDGATFHKPIRVNSHPGSAIAVGNIRGAHLAVASSGRVHVVWNGSHHAKPRGPGEATPMLYTRLNDAGDAFEPERNLITKAAGLDGGGSIAVSDKHVWVFWHAPTPGTKGEQQRRVWLTASTDEGKTFAPETPISPPPTGVCGCCGLRAFDVAVAPGILYRSAQDTIHRDMYLLTLASGKTDFDFLKLETWDTGTCPMSSSAFVATPTGGVIAWETEGQVSYARLGSAGAKVGSPISAPGNSKARKHPTLAANGSELLVAWTEGMGWMRGGALAWQLFDGQDRPVAAARGRADGVPVWSLIAAAPLAKGRYLILY